MTPAFVHRPPRRRRSRLQRLKDVVSFPVRALTLFHDDRWGFSCQATERYDEVAARVCGRCLDIGCGTNRFVREFLGGDSVGADVHRYAGNHDGVLLEDPCRLPWADGAFDTVTFIANLNHVPADCRDAELAEACRVLTDGGAVIVTMGLPAVELAVHGVIWLYDRLLGTAIDHDNIRGMAAGEAYYITGREIRDRLKRAGFERVTYHPFATQWWLNGMYIGRKPAGAATSPRAATGPRVQRCA